MIPALTHWESYYVIVGSSAAALTGLQFVVMTLIADSRLAASSRTIAAFGTPTVVHFGTTLILAAVLSAPWHSFTGAAWCTALVGIGGIVYGGLVVRRARAAGDYQPVAEDWIWHTILPIFAYTAVFIASIELPGSPDAALFVLAGASLLLLFIGIHHSWDTVTYITLAQRNARGRDEDVSSKSQTSTDERP